MSTELLWYVSWSNAINNNCTARVHDTPIRVLNLYIDSNLKVISRPGWGSRVLNVIECYRIQGMIKIRFEQLKGGLPIKNLKYGQWPTFVLIIPFPQWLFLLFSKFQTGCITLSFSFRFNYFPMIKQCSITCMVFS